MNKLGNNTKTAKAPEDWTNLILHLSPMKKAFQIWKAHKEQVEKLVMKRMKRDEALLPHEVELIARFNSCPWAGFCGKICLDTAGRGKFSNVQIARAAKTIHYILDQKTFENELCDEIAREESKAFKALTMLAIRLNGTSDVNWVETINKFPNVQFYDYTKNHLRMKQFLNGIQPKNYHLTFSYDKDMGGKSFVDYHGMIFHFMEQGGNIAIMQGDFDRLAASPSLRGNVWKTIDGDKHDLRFFDGKAGAFVILQEKGDAKK